MENDIDSCSEIIFLNFNCDNIGKYDIIYIKFLVRTCVKI